MYDFDLTLPFQLGVNSQTVIFFLNLGIPILYFVNFAFLVIKLKGMKKDEPFYTFIKSLMYFFFFYGLGAIYFIWYDFYYMDFMCPNPLSVLSGIEPAPPELSVHLWQIGNLIQNVGLLLMLLQLRKRIFKSKVLQIFPVVWEAIGMGLMIFTLLNFFFSLGVYIPLISDVPIYWMDMNYIFNFALSLFLPITYFYIWRHMAGDLRKYSFMLFIFFLLYGLAWGFRSRIYIYTAIPIIDWLTYELLWLFRAGIMVFFLSLVFYAYKKLLSNIESQKLKE